MIAGRLRECLKKLRWDANDIAELLSCGPSEAEAWLDGRASVPLAVAAWLEALVRAHQILPPPSLSSEAKTPVEAADASLALENGEACWRVPAAQGFFPRRALAANQSSAPPRPPMTIAM